MIFLSVFFVANPDEADFEQTYNRRGKSGKVHQVEVEDKRLAQIVRECQDIPGQELFQYLDANGKPQPIQSEDVNDYLQEISGSDFTAKDFRTWAGTVLAGIALQEFQKFDSQAQAKKNVVQAIESVAARLGNTPSVCKKCYIHPEILDGYLQGATIQTIRDRAESELKKGLHQLRPEEAAVVAFLQKRLVEKAQPSEKLLKRSLNGVKQRRGARTSLSARTKSTPITRTGMSALRQRR